MTLRNENPTGKKSVYDFKCLVPLIALEICWLLGENSPKPPYACGYRGMVIIKTFASVWDTNHK